LGTRNFLYAKSPRAKKTPNGDGEPPKGLRKKRLKKKDRTAGNGKSATLGHGRL